MVSSRIFDPLGPDGAQESTWYLIFVTLLSSGSASLLGHPSPPKYELSPP